MSNLITVHHTNRLGKDTALWMRGETRVETGIVVTEEESTTWGVGGSIATKGSFGIPGVAGAETTITVEGRWETSSSKSTAKSELESDTIAWQINGAAGPGETIMCKAVSLKAETPPIVYRGKKVVTFKDGKQLKFDVSGNFGITRFSRSMSICEPSTEDEFMKALIAGDPDVQVYENGQRVDGGEGDNNGGTVPPTDTPLDDDLDKRSEAGNHVYKSGNTISWTSNTEEGLDEFHPTWTFTENGLVPRTIGSKSRARIMSRSE